jgi:hypothetical protein
MLSTCGFAEFSSKWRTRFSHLRGGSYNYAVVQILIVMLAYALERWTRVWEWPQLQFRHGAFSSLR